MTLDDRYTVDKYTGEIIEKVEEELNGIVPLSDPTMIAIMSGKVPMHIQKLYEKNLSSDEEEYQVDLFTGVEPQSLKAYINKTVTVIGAVAWPHGSFVRASDERGGNGKKGDLADGYWQILMALEEKDSNGDNIVLASSGVNIIPHMMLAMSKKGWYLWDKPTKYQITLGSKSGAFFMKNVERHVAKVKVVDHKA